MSIIVGCGWLVFGRLSPALESPLDKHLMIVSGPTSWLGVTCLLQQLAFNWLGKIVLQRLSISYITTSKLPLVKTYIHPT